MSLWEIGFYLIISGANLVIATQVAQNGWLESGLQRPLNPRAVTACLINVLAWAAAGVLQRFFGVPVLNNLPALFLVVAIPLLWIWVRRGMMSPGRYDFNRARIRTSYLSRTSCAPGQRTPPERAGTLRNSAAVRETIQLFERAITKQLQGRWVRTAEVSWPLSALPQGDPDSFHHYQIRCPVCPATMWFADIRGQNISGPCPECGSAVTVRIEGETLYASGLLPQPVRRVSVTNRLNAALGYEELGWLYRIMNLFGEANNALTKGLAMVEELLKADPDNRYCLGAKSMLLFHRAEAAHARGAREEARAGYEASLAIDRRLGDQGGVDTLVELLRRLGTAG